MSKTSQQIAQNLLKEAGYYWYDDNEDNVSPLNPDDYDPVVDKIFKANAIELEKLYSEIDESQKEIVLGLSQSLVPDQSLLPEPGYTVAQILPKAQRVSLIPEDEFQINGQSDTGDNVEYYFTPLMDHSYPFCQIEVMLTDHAIIQLGKTRLEIIQETSTQNTTESLWLGLKLGKIEKGDQISFFIGNKIFDEYDKNYHLLHTAKWLVNGDPQNELKVQQGVDAFSNQKNRSKDLLDILEVPNTYEKQILSRLKNSFIHCSISPGLEKKTHSKPPNFINQSLLDVLDIKTELCWIKLEFPLPLARNFILKNTFYPNAIPVVNRNLISKSAVKNNFDRILLPMPTEDLFLDVHKIQDARNRNDVPETSYSKINFLQPEDSPGTYILRSGSRIRRMNREDATRQITRLLQVINDEYNTFKEEGVNRLRQDFEDIEQAMDRIKGQLPELFRADKKKASYFCKAVFRHSVNRLYYSYWETQGDKIAQLGKRIHLNISSSTAHIANSTTLIPIKKGKSELTSEDYINQLKIGLLSKQKIMTKGDIELYCKGRYGKILEVENVGISVMRLQEGKIGRGILVKVKSLQELSESELDFIRVELQNDLNAKSMFFTPIKVAINNGA